MRFFGGPLKWVMGGKKKVQRVISQSRVVKTIPKCRRIDEKPIGEAWKGKRGGRVKAFKRRRQGNPERRDGGLRREKQGAAGE